MVQGGALLIVAATDSGELLLPFVLPRRQAHVFLGDVGRLLMGRSSVGPRRFQIAPQREQLIVLPIAFRADGIHLPLEPGSLILEVLLLGFDLLFELAQFGAQLATFRNAAFLGLGHAIGTAALRGQLRSQRGQGLLLFEMDRLEMLGQFLLAPCGRLGQLDESIDLAKQTGDFRGGLLVILLMAVAFRTQRFGLNPELFDLDKNSGSFFFPASFRGSVAFLPLPQLLGGFAPALRQTAAHVPRRPPGDGLPIPAQVARFPRSAPHALPPCGVRFRCAAAPPGAALRRP